MLAPVLVVSTLPAFPVSFLFAYILVLGVLGNCVFCILCVLSLGSENGLHSSNTFELRRLSQEFYATVILFCNRNNISP